MGYGGGGMIGFDFEPFGHLSVEEADQLIHKECFEELCENFPSRNRHWNLFPVCRDAQAAKIPFEEGYPLIAHALETKGGRPEGHNEIKDVWNWCATKGLTKNKIGEESKANENPTFPEHNEVEAENILGLYEKRLAKLGKKSYRTMEEFGNETPSVRMETRKGYLGSHKCLSILFADDPMLCYARKPYDFVTEYLSNMRNLNGYNLVCPNRYLKKYGKKAEYVGLPDEEVPKEGWSQHTKDNVGEKEYQVVAFDNASFDYQCRAIFFLRKFLPLGMLLHSGNKSAHAWFSVRGVDSQYVEDFFKLACLLGADPSMWDSFMLVRMPNVIRNDSKVRDKLQEVYFLVPPEEQTTCPITKGMEFDMPIVG